jgi:YD repeat-containing protein
VTGEGWSFASGQATVSDSTILSQSGRVLQDSITDSGVTQPYKSTYTYDAAGRLTGATVPDNTAPAPKRRGRPASQPAPLPPGTPREVAQHEAQQQAEASAEPITVPPAQPQVTQTVPMATALCPHCNVEIGPNRVYPAAGGGFVIMHAHCPVKQDTVILPVQMEES